MSQFFKSLESTLRRQVHLGEIGNNTLVRKQLGPKAKIRDLTSTGVLPSFRVGRLIRIPVQALKDYEQCAPATALECGSDTVLNT
jgi:excisionase family DNA binding protein